MKQGSEEKKIKELFQRLKREDERHSSSFAGSWEAARSRLETRSARSRVSNWPRWSLAALAAILIVFGFFIYRAIQNEPEKLDDVITEKRAAPTPRVKLEERVVKEKFGPRRPRRGSRMPRHNRRRNIEPFIIYNETVYAKRDEYASDFIPLTGAGVQKPMESGEVVRMQMPRSALIAFGLPVNVEYSDTPVNAELLLGEDGMPRAIRFIR